MINANELRLNNWVQYDGRHFQIESIGSALPFLKTIEFGVGVVHYGNIQPIPLTEDILLKCGFDCFQDGWYRKRITPIEFTWNIYDYTLRVMGYSFGNIKSLHQLQNLYFALTGEELKINL